MQPWWAHVVWLVLMGLVMGWLARSRKRANANGPSRVLTHPPSSLIVGVVCTLVFLAFAALAALSTRPNERWASLFFVAFSLLGVAVIVEALRVRIELKDEGIAYRGLIHRYESVPWTDLVSAHFSPSMKWLVLTTRDGTKLRFSGMLNGLDALATALHERAPTLRADDATAKVLADARAGTLPTIWQ